ncbi:MAG: dihydroxyacetone kinase subunit DhaK [Suipraeoptans sp.]
MRLWNKKDNAPNQALEGIVLANPDKYTRLSSKYGYGLYRKNLPSNQVRIIINGGGGYGPMWSGLADDNLADAMVHGEFDSAPNAYVLYEMAKEIDCGYGVLFLTNHFMGDYLNNDMAVELLEHDGILARACYISDDILSAKGEDKEQRGGLHGIGQICKIAANAAKKKLSLEEIYTLVEKANERLRSVTVNIRNKNMFFGEGFSGEPAVMTMKYSTVAKMIEVADSILLKEMKEWNKDSFYISINVHCSVGHTESFIILNEAVTQLKQKGIEVHGCAVGTYFDVFKGSGCMISFLACDEELQKYLFPVAGYNFTL